MVTEGLMTIMLCIMLQGREVAPILIIEDVLSNNCQWCQR